MEKRTKIWTDCDVHGPHVELSRSFLHDFDLANSAKCEGAVDVVACWEKNDRLIATDIKSDEHLYVHGWSFATKPRAPFDEFFFIVDGTQIFPVQYGLPRADAVRHHHDPSILHCGFGVRFPVATLEPGEHELTFAGRSGDRLQTFGVSRIFCVLASAGVVSAIAPAIVVPGRVRAVRETRDYFAQHLIRHDGRTDRAIRHRRSFFISGWAAASPNGNTPDAVAVLLFGESCTYRLPAARRQEPEAGAALGPDAAACGYQTCAAAADFIPGIYQVGVELTIGSQRGSVRTNEWLEIMSDNYSWLPSALPTYQTALTADLVVTLPARFQRDDHLVLAGWLESVEPISDIFARIDGETTYLLTSRKAAAGETVFGGILSALLTTGAHELEILALDATQTGAWSIRRHAFEITT